MVIDGKAVAKKIQANIAKEIKEQNYTPGIAFILIGEDIGSKAYVRMKQKACKELGIRSTVIHKPDTISESELLSLIEKLNDDAEIDGILCQMPVPNQISQEKVLNTISPLKDIDGFHPFNVGKLATGDRTGFLPCTPYGVIRLLEAYHFDPSGKEVVILGRSNIVGRPLSIMLSQKRPFGNATVTLAHSQTKNIEEVCRRADILIAAIGKAKFVKADMVRPGAIVIDVGMNRLEGKLIGDVDYDSVSLVAEAITPAPGGVGPMTIAMLMENTLKSYKARSLV